MSLLDAAWVFLEAVEKAVSTSGVRSPVGPNTEAPLGLERRPKIYYFI